MNVDATELAPEQEQTDRGRWRFGLTIWALLFFNVLPFNGLPTLIPIPGTIGKLATQGALVGAVLLVLAFNRDRLTRPNLFLTLFTILSLSSLMMSVRLGTGVGMLFRAVRLCSFVSVLWLLTPVWGRRDRANLEWHIYCLTGVLATVVLGLVLAPGRAFQVDGRLSGQIWPLPPPQVGHLAAVLSGIVAVLWVSGEMRGRRALLLGGGATTVLLMSHTRTAVLGLVIAATVATLSLMLVRRRARRIVVVMVIAGTLALTVFAPAISHWYSRGESSAQVGQLNGRRQVWDALIKAKRSRLAEVFGAGNTNDSFGGLSIDNSWLSTYQDQGWFGMAICAAVLASLLLIASLRPRGPNVAVALFLVIFCAVSSVTETGLGGASPYILDLAVAASLLAMPGNRASTQVVDR